MEYFLTEQDRIRLDRLLAREDGRRETSGSTETDQPQPNAAPEVYVAVPPCDEGIPARSGATPGYNDCCIFQLCNTGTLASPVYQLQQLLQRNGDPVRRRVFNIYDTAMDSRQDYIQIQRDKYGSWLCERPEEFSTATTTTTTTTLEPCLGRCHFIANAELKWELDSNECHQPATTTTEDPDSGGTECLCPATTTTPEPEMGVCCDYGNEDCFPGFETQAECDHEHPGSIYVPGVEDCDDAPCTTTTTDNPCDCMLPDFCPTEEGQCTYTRCARGSIEYPDELIDCHTTTTTSTTEEPLGGCCDYTDPENPECYFGFTSQEDCDSEHEGSQFEEGVDCGEINCSVPQPTTTTENPCDCNTTTTECPCDLGCDWIYVPIQGWNKIRDDCGSCCSCGPPDGDFDECVVYTTPCLIPPEPPPPPKYCRGGCVYYYFGPMDRLIFISSDCDGSGVTSCTCVQPETPGDPTFCGYVTSPCQTPATTTTEEPLCANCYTTTTGEPTTTTTTTTTTTECPGDCFFECNEEDAWVFVSSTCESEGCSCYQPLYPCEEDCEVYRTGCYVGTTTTGEPTTTTTTTEEPLCENCPDIISAECTEDCLDALPVTCDGLIMPECLKIVARSNLAEIPTDCHLMCRTGEDREPICEADCVCWDGTKYAGTLTLGTHTFDVTFQAPPETPYLFSSGTMTLKEGGVTVDLLTGLTNCDAEDPVEFFGGNFEMPDDLCEDSEINNTLAHNLSIGLFIQNVCGSTTTTTTTTTTTPEPTGSCCQYDEEGAFLGCTDGVTLTFCNTHTPPVTDSTWHQGATCDGDPCLGDPDFGACCNLNSGTCNNDVPAGDCEESYQQFFPGELCASVECEATTTTSMEPIGACCNCNEVGEDCIYFCEDGLTETECAELPPAPGGIFYSGGDCATLISLGACPVEETTTTDEPVGACCDNVASCTDGLTASECTALEGGWYLGDLCSENPCNYEFGTCCDNVAENCFASYTSLQCDAQTGGLGQWIDTLDFCDACDFNSATTTSSEDPNNGACCDLSNGACYDGTDNTFCNPPDFAFYPGQLCSEIVCE